VKRQGERIVLLFRLSTIVETEPEQRRVDDGQSQEERTYRK